MTVTVDRSIGQCDFNGVSVGFGQPLQWGLGDKLGAQPLGTRTAQIVFYPGTQQQTAPLSLAQSASGLFWQWTPTQRWTGTLKYVLIGQQIEGGPMVPLVQGNITLGVVLNP